MILRPCRLAVLLLAGLSLSACDAARRVSGTVFGDATPEGQPGFVRGFLGGIAADEPLAAAAGREVLAAGGSAVDAAVAAGFVLAVTLPSRAGLGGGGACLVFDPRRPAGPEAVLFEAPAASAAGADRPAAVPLMARGLFALHTRQPTGRPFEELVAPAEQLARFGAPMSRALHADLLAVQAPLFADPAARAVFARGDAPVAVGQSFSNPALGATLTALRVAGVGDLHQGGLARRLEEAVPLAGGGAMGAEALRGALPRVAAPATLPGAGGDRVSFLPGGAAAGAYEALRAGGAPAPLPGRYGASTGLVAFDRNGMAVSCAFSLNNLFGTGRVAPGLGFLLAAAPGVGGVPAAPLAAAIGWNPNVRAFRMAVAGSGQETAPLAVAAPLLAGMERGAPTAGAALRAVPEPGRAVAGLCPRYLPGFEGLCTTAADGRGAGVALGAVDPGAVALGTVAPGAVDR